MKDAWIHDFRRTRATIWHKDKGVTRDLVMSMTGHKTDSMFRRYQIATTKHVERLAEEWNKEKESTEDEREEK